mmetsp:Transcript_16068/g.11588  ORF Transcript_16068/g.11588 Transcript_16068/m.11588 type:complete len:99 (-) Transcript_16068:81-377(-)|eukprot:CAMPEP_0202965626 /NCGR_PEP_ID=MMETSP1396-20130829/9537_1 /ASSEMBLY_ACC=CAM_ASM_000872 /TAXON_ID= /ORGANISM="Pseudokeronopsis sp., Strain Brazil" /LENGTH=98 /DNA_ID=CAMNT_0049688397 /DNA_START=1038 /DNA_END=1334 /DNA_ORIENTATION=-
MDWFENSHSSLMVCIRKPAKALFQHENCPYYYHGSSEASTPRRKPIRFQYQSHYNSSEEGGDDLLAGNDHLRRQKELIMRKVHQKGQPFWEEDEEVGK